jgi:hypothetical protein
MANTGPPSSDIHKNEVETVESIHKPAPTTRGKDKAAELLASNERIVVTAEENKRVLRKIDLIILPILLSVYFLQSLGKVIKPVVGISTDIRLSRQDNTFVRLSLRSHRRCESRSQLGPVLLAGKHCVHCAACHAAFGRVLSRQVSHWKVRGHHGADMGRDLMRNGRSY